MKRGILALLLALALFSGCGYEQTDAVIEPTPQAVETEEVEPTAESPSPSPKVKEAEKVPESTPTPIPTPKATEAPPTPEAAETPEAVTECTLSVRCDSVLENIEKFDEGKREIVPPDGVIFAEQSVEFSDGESVFDILLREMRDKKIHFEFVHTPMYDSAYIEGIGNLYEFDCGNLSGWMYKVNGINPTYGCSQYKVKNGDRIEFYYSCNFLDG